MRVAEWQLGVEPTYAGLKNGAPSREENSPFTEELEEVLENNDPDELAEIFGSPLPFTIAWSFQATNVTTGGTIPIFVNTNCADDAVRIDFVPSLFPEERIRVTLPSNAPNTLVELTAEAVVQDPFGMVSVVRRQLCSHVLQATDWDQSDAVLSNLVSLVQGDAGEFFGAGELNPLLPEDPRIEDPRCRLARIMRIYAFHATEDGLIEASELASLIQWSQMYAAVRGGATVKFVGNDLTTGPHWRTASIAKPNDADGDNIYGTEGYFLPRATADQSFHSPFMPLTNASILQTPLGTNRLPTYLTALRYANPLEQGSSILGTNGIYGILNNPGLPGFSGDPGAGILLGGQPEAASEAMALVLTRRESPAFRLTLIFGNNAAAAGFDPAGQEVSISDGLIGAMRTIPQSAVSNVVTYQSWDITAGSNALTLIVDSLTSAPSRLSGIAIDLVPPRLHFRRAGGELTLFWSDPGSVLQESGDPTSPANWRDIPGGEASPVRVAVSQPQSRFFRLRSQ